MSNLGPKQNENGAHNYLFHFGTNSSVTNLHPSKVLTIGKLYLILYFKFKKYLNKLRAPLPWLIKSHFRSHYLQPQSFPISSFVDLFLRVCDSKVQLPITRVSQLFEASIFFLHHLHPLSNGFLFFFSFLHASSLKLMEAEITKQQSLLVINLLLLMC